MIRKKKHILQTHTPLFAILLIFLILATIYNLSLPLYESPDEFDHFIYVNWLSAGRGLPDLNQDLLKIGHEGVQPPLYYALLAPIVAAIDTTDISTIAPENPFWHRDLGPNVHYHTPAEQFPYHNTALAVHLARFVSTLVAVVTIVSTYGLARLLIPGKAALATALVAFNPQFIFVSAAITNDTQIAALSAASMWLLIWVITSKKVSWWQYLLLGGIWGLALLSKLSGLALSVIITVGLMLQAKWKRSWQVLIWGSAGVFVGLLVVSGWWIVRNMLLYGDPLAWSMLLFANRGLVRQEKLSWLDSLKEVAILRKSFWGMFSYGIPAPTTFYWLVYIIMLLALLGLGLWL